MIKSTIEEIKKTAQEYAANGIKWHFHILTPECTLNTTKEYALILENASNDTMCVCYSATPYMTIGKELVQLLHGKDVIKETKEQKELPPSPKVEKLIQRAKELIEKGVFWHHHMLFPYCAFNKQKGKWAILFEDKENNEVIESISETEPKSDLQHIEALFYSQKKQ